MDRYTLAVVLQEGTRFISEILRSRPPKRQTAENELPPIEYEEALVLAEDSPSNAGSNTEVATGCIPCSLGHLGTCSGLLNEAMRFARSEGLNSEEVIGRINACMDEISSLERVDLRPEKIVTLPKEDKELANQALVESRNIRHGLEGISTVDELEELAAKTQKVRNNIGTEWFRHRLANMPKEEKAKLAKKAIERLEKT